jgi:hypothetical protein
MSYKSTRHTTTMIGSITSLPRLPDDTLEYGDLYLFNDAAFGGAYLSDDGTGFNQVWRLLGAAANVGTTFSTQIVPGASDGSTVDGLWYLANDAQVPIDRHTSPIPGPFLFPVATKMVAVTVATQVSVNTLSDFHTIEVHLYRQGVDVGIVATYPAGVTGEALTSFPIPFDPGEGLDIVAKAMLSDGEGFVISATVVPAI